MKICIIGTGYVGLVSGTCFAEAGNEVTCVDIDENKIKALKSGQIPIFEPGLEPMVTFNLSEGRLHFTTDLKTAINSCDLAFIAVGTPPDEDGSADLTHVLEVTQAIGKISTKKIILGVKSTVPVGTGDKIEAALKCSTTQPFVVFSNPEFLKEGDAINDFMKPDRVIIGLENSEILPLLQELYGPFTHKKDRLLIMDRRSAELTKYAANAMLATRISFMNELANLAEKTKADINQIRLGIGSDPRIGPEFLYPGLGYGGSCFPKDVKALLNTAKQHEEKLWVLESVDKANDYQKEVMCKKIFNYFGKTNLSGIKIALWGLAFKAKTDDIRESSALVMAQKLLAAGAQITAFDPQAMGHASKILDDKITFAKSNYECLQNAHALVIATDWNEFKSPDFDKMKSLMASPIIFDGRNILNRKNTEKRGFTYHGVGV